METNEKIWIEINSKIKSLSLLPIQPLEIPPLLLTAQANKVKRQAWAFFVKSILFFYQSKFTTKAQKNRPIK